MVNLIHDIDLIRHLVGEVTSVQAMTANSLRGHAVEDSCTVLLGFANGAPGTASVSDGVPAPWSWELTAAENPAYAPTGESCYLIGGTEGSLDLPRLRLWRHDGGGDWWSPIAAQVAPPAPPATRWCARSHSSPAPSWGTSRPWSRGSRGCAPWP